MNEITRRLFNRGSVRVKVDQRNLRLILEPARAVWALDSNKNMFVVTADTRSACLSENLQTALTESVRNFYVKNK